MGATFVLLAAIFAAPPAVSWQASLPPGDAFTLAAAGDAVVAFRGGRLQALDVRDGRLRWQTTRLARGPAAVLADAGELVTVEPDRVVVRDLRGGMPVSELKLPILRGDVVFLARLGAGRYALGVLAPPVQDGPPPLAGTLDLVSAGAAPRPLIPPSPFKAARLADGFVLATPSGLSRVGRDGAMRTLGAISAAAVEGGPRIHIITGGDAPRLQRFSLDGKRELDAPLPPDLFGLRLLAGPDGVVYVLGGRNLAALDARGALRWTCKLDVDIAGAVPLGDRLLVAAGDAILAFDAAGRRTLWLKLPHPAASAPVLAQGRVCVATRASVLCATP